METKRSAVWKYFTDLRKIDGSHFVECKLCNRKYSHKGNTTNMFHHLKANHSTVYSDILRQKQLSSESNQSMPATITRNNSYDVTVPQPIEVKLEPTFIDVDHHTNIPDNAHVDEIPSESVSLEAKNDVTYHQANISQISEELEPMTPQPSSSYVALFGGPSRCSAKKCKSDDDLGTKIGFLSSEINDIKEAINRIAGGGDQHFFHSIANEFENMDDDSRDLIKVAIWQLIYKAKCARKKKTELALNDLLK